MDRQLSNSQCPGLGIMLAGRLSDSYKKLNQAHRFSSGKKASNIYKPFQDS